MSGKVLVGCAAVGVISVFLPAVSVSLGSGSVSVSCVDGWQGKFGLLCYIALLVLGILALRQAPPRNRGLLFAVIGVAAGAMVLAAFLLMDVLKIKMGSIAVGTIVDLAAAAGTGAAAFLMAKEDKLF